LFFTTEAPTWTPFPTQTATVTVTITITDLPGPTLDVSPEFATLAPEAPTQPPVEISTLVPSDATAESFTSPTPTNFPTLPPITPPPTVSLDSVLLTLPLGVTVGALPFEIGPGGLSAAPAPGDLAYRPFSLSNPSRSNERVFTDEIGALYWEVNGQAQGLPAPFTIFGPESLENSDRLVTSAAWSADGTKVAFVVDNPNRCGAEDGVWWWDTASNQVFHVMHHCRRGVNNCPDYVSAPGAPYTNDPENPDPGTGWYTQSVSWSPNGSQILARLRLGEEARLGFIVLPATRDENFKKQRGPVCIYEYSDWARDGSGVLVAGRDSQSQQVTGIVTVPNACTGFESLGTSQVTDSRVTPIEPQSAAGVPLGVIEGSRLSAGQVLVVSSSTGGLNLRTAPVEADNVLRYVLTGEQVSILAGPYNSVSASGQLEWWQVTTYDRLIGWMAGRINGGDTFTP
jgi:hypothetical protein